MKNVPFASFLLNDLEDFFKGLFKKGLGRVFMGSTKNYSGFFWIFVLAFLIVGCSAATTTSGIDTKSASLAWDANPVEDNVTGYRVYYGTASRDYSGTVDAGLQIAQTVTGLPNAHVYFAVTAYNAAGLESDFSNEVSVNFPLTGKARTVTLDFTQK